MNELYCGQRDFRRVLVVDLRDDVLVTVPTGHETPRYINERSPDGSNASIKLQFTASWHNADNHPSMNLTLAPMT